MRSRKASAPERHKAQGGRRGDRRGTAIDANANPQNSELQARQCAEEIRSLAKRTVEDIIKIGRLLTHAKEKLIPYGGWLPWLDRELGWSADTATNFMNVYKLSRRPKFRKIRNMARLAPSVLYALAKAPEEVAVPIMARIERGETVSPRFVTVTVAEHKQKNVSPNYEPDPSPPELPWPAITMQFPASVAEPEQPADDEPETPEAAKEVRTARLTDLRAAFFIRVRMARENAVYSGPVSADIIARARQVAAAWAALADELERRLHGEEAPGTQADENAASHERMLEGLKATADTEAHVARWRERKERGRA